MSRTFICPDRDRDRPDEQVVPAGRWARRPLTGHGLESQLDVTAVNKLFTWIISHKYDARPIWHYVFMCTARLGLPSLPRAGAVLDDAIRNTRERIHAP